MRAPPNPLGPDTSLDAEEQWHNDVDYLVDATINMPTHRRHWAHHSIGYPVLSPMLSRTPMMVRTPIAMSLATTDLKAELERRRSREDDHTTIES
jgi:hypothetical protein